MVPEELARLRAEMHSTSFPAGTNLFMVDQPGEVAYIILQGAVKVHVEQADGTEVIIAILGPGETVGELSVVDKLGRSASVHTMDDTTALWIGRAFFWDCLQTMPVLASNLVRILSRRIRLANARIEVLSTLDVHGRVARQLLTLADEYGQPSSNGGTIIPLRLTQSDLASLVGASRVRVNQVLVSYQRSRWLSIDQRYHITILNPKALAETFQY
jgi:CRP/FNR family cyclic AMP-dependent transcriptional regulator